VVARHPRVTGLELRGWSARDGSGGEDDTLEEIKDVEKQSGVDWV